MKEIINTNEAPKAIGTYSQAVKAGGLLFISGQVGMDAVTAELVSDDFTLQTKQVFINIQAILEAADATFADVIKFNVSVTDLSHFEKFNSVLASFVAEPYPARAVVEVKALPKDALVEVESIAISD